MSGSTPRTLAAVALLLGAVVSVARAAAPAKTTGAGASEPTKAIALSTAVVPASGTQSAQVQVARFGRYALSASSAQGTAVQVVDRMAGPGEVRGEPGVRNGRVDLFLERGEYRLRAISDPAGKGDARLEARAFTEVSGPKPPLLPDDTISTSTLADLEQRSWWVRLEDDDDLAVELAGRSLADVRLWRDGQWLDPAEPACEEITPETGRPLNRCAITTHLGAGLWQLVAYGGPPLAWGDPSGDQPLHVRRGMPTLAAAGRLAGAIGPFGTERWRVPGSATAFRLELPSGADASVSVRPFSSADPYRRDGTVGRIRKETMPPVAEVSASSSSDDKVVTIVGAAGQPFSLQHFPAGGRTIGITGSGPFYVATLHAGDPADRADVTGVLAEARTGATPLAASLIPLTAERGYRRKFNLLGTVTLDFEVTEGRSWQTAVSAGDAGWRWEPLLTTRPAGYTSPSFRHGPGAVELTPGRWTLTLQPEKPGIAEVVVRADAMQKVEPTPPRAGLRFDRVELASDKRYTLTLNQDEGRVGLIQRSLPLDLTDAVPVTLAPGDVATLASTVPSAGEVSAGAGLEVSVDGGDFAASAKVGAGSHDVRVRNAGTSVVAGALGFEAADRRRDAPLPELPDTAVTTPPALPALTTDAARFLDLAEDATATYRVDVAKAGLYRVESTGLLATAGAIRTRTRPVLASADQNGTGRNFLLQTYLREGDYQVTVGAQGASAGHLGLSLAPATLRDGGELRPGLPARATVPANEGVVYRFDTSKPGKWALRSFGMGRLFRVRLEDADGWPFLAPESDADLTLDLPAGSWRVVVLPEPTETRRITTLDAVVEPVALHGHGPHPLTLDAPANLTWWEPAAGEPRDPDVWTFDLAAAADVTITATGEMAGDLRKKGASDPVGRLVPGRPWEGRLDPGSYYVELANARRNSGVSYDVRVSPRELVPGLSRELALPAEVPVSVGPDGLVEIASMGGVDVKARLLDAGGRVVATSDDRPDDWNFRIAERLPQGAYTLRVEPVGASSGRCRVDMSVATETEAQPLALGQPRELRLSGAVARVAFAPPADGLVWVHASSAENVAIAVESLVEGGWRTVGRASGKAPGVVVRLGAPGRSWRARVESLDERGVPATIEARAIDPKTVGEGAASGGTSIATAGGVGASVVKRVRPGTLEMGSVSGLSWCPAAGEVCVPVSPGLVAPPDADAWFVAQGDRAVPLRAARWSLASAPGRVSVVAGREAVVDVVAGGGPVAVIARAEAGLAGVRIGDATGATAEGSAVSDGAGIAVALLPAQPVARVFAASSHADALDVDLTRVAFGAPTTGALTNGSATVTLQAGTAWRAAVPKGQVELALGAGVAAVFSRGTETLATHWAADAARALVVTTDADTITLLATGKGATTATVRARPLVGKAPAIGAAAPLEDVATAAGWTVAALDGAPDGTLHVRGSATEAVVSTKDGHAGRGADVRVGAGAERVEIRHGTGPWIAWIDRLGDESRVLWGGPPPPAPASAVAAPGSVALAAEVETVGAEPTGPGILQVRAEQPVVALVRRDAGKARTLLALDGRVAVAVDGPGRLDVSIRPVGGGLLRGAARVDFAAAATLAEGLGTEGLLGPGDTLAWSFTLDRDAPVGVGVRTEGPGVRVSLHDADGKLLGEGPAQMPTLRKGTYLLSATLDADAAPAHVRPAIVGLVPPDTGPPADVIRTYLVAAGLLPGDEPSATDEASE